MMASASQIDSRLSVIMALCAAACVAGVAALVKWTAGQGLPVLEILFFRSLFAFIPLGAYLAWTGGWRDLRTARPVGHLVRAVVGIAGTICAFAAVAVLPLAEATGLSFTAPLFMTALSALLLGERIGWHRWLAVAAGFAGVVLMTGPQLAAISPRGALLALGGAVGAAGAMIAIRKIGCTERSSTIVFYFTLLGVLVGAISLLFQWRAPGPAVLAALLGAGVLGGIGQLLMTGAARRSQLAVIAPFDYSQLVWTGGIGFLVWDETPSLRALAGSAVIAGCGVYVLLREFRARQKYAAV
jgi:drug/metabolite transporter (DMT)-like permease